MLEKIWSLTDKRLVINLTNVASKKIYNLDSINLIIGDNGSGKTKLIKSVIRDLCTVNAEAEFMIDGATDELGVIYYTAAPFHQIIKIGKGEKIPFADASPAPRSKQSFVKTAHEYVRVAELLELDVPMQYSHKYDFELFASRLVSAMFHSSQMRASASPELGVLLEEFYQANSDYLTFESNRRKAFNILGGLHSSVHPLKFGSESDKYSKADIENLSRELERLAKVRTEKRKAAVERLLLEIGPRSKKRAIAWVTAARVMDSVGISSRQDFALRFYSDEFTGSGVLTRKWESAFSTLTQLVNKVGKGTAGEFEWTRRDAVFTVRIPELLESNLDEEVMEAASETGFIKIGFDSLSSGEAAVTHQLASISHWIHTMASAGKQSFIIFIDEGDLLLHLSWQRKYLELIDLRLSSIREKLNLTSIQVVVATHSPMLTSDALRESITKLGLGRAPSGFGAPLQKIVNYSFGTPAIGAIAEKTIKRLKEAETLDADDEKIVAQIDDEFLRDYIMQKKKK